ncbi:MAG: hypothetical protein ACI87T_002040, partial [Planctomycetota bacterium]
MTLDQGRHGMPQSARLAHQLPSLQLQTCCGKKSGRVPSLPPTDPQA